MHSFINRFASLFKRVKCSENASMDGLNNFPQAQGSDDAATDTNSPAPLTREQKNILFVSAAVPMVGFGFMDNMVMITMGEVAFSPLPTVPADLPIFLSSRSLCRPASPSLPSSLIQSVVRAVSSSGFVV